MNSENGMNQISDVLRDFKGDGDCVEIEILRDYAPTQPLHVTKRTGLVFVKERRSSEEIARE